MDNKANADLFDVASKLEEEVLCSARERMAFVFARRATPFVSLQTLIRFCLLIKEMKIE